MPYKIVVGIISMLLCVLVGYFLSMKYSDKRKFYGDFVDFNNTLKTEVAFSKSSIIKILQNSNKENSLFYTCVSKYFFDSEVKIALNKAFSQEDVEFLNRYLKSVGVSDKDSQIAFINSVESTLNDKYKLVANDEKKYRSLLVKLGFFIGLIAFILIV